MKDYSCIVREHREIVPGYRFLVVENAELAAALRPGQFVHVRVPGLEPSALRRPFSVFDAADGCVSILYKRVGRGTASLNEVPADAVLSVEGPLGKPFPVESPAVALLVGGGYGVAPLHFLARLRTERGLPNELFVGGRSAQDILAVSSFEKLNVPVRITTNDGSLGQKGFVTAALDARLAELRAAGSAFELYVCGPDGLLKAIADRARELGVPGWISVDRHMICGVGACYACIQKTIHGNARCCVDGPVFRADELIWE